MHDATLADLPGALSPRLLGVCRQRPIEFDPVTLAQHVVRCAHLPPHTCCDGFPAVEQRGNLRSM